MSNSFKMNKEKGYISLYRSLMEHYIYPNHRVFTEFEAFIDMLFLANYKDNKLLVDFKLVEIKRGDFMTSELKLSLRWLWSRDRVRKFLALLQKDNMIIKNSNSKFTMITICNYNDYQQNATAKQQHNNNNATTEQQQNNTTNKDNKVNKENKFVLPTIQEIADYCLERNNGIDAEYFYNHYQSKGWLIGKNKMKDWRAAVITWEKNNKEKHTEVVKTTLKTCR